jgi:hypothetical protein
VVIAAEGHLFQARLPDGVAGEPGRRLDLQVIKTQPQVVFLLRAPSTGEASGAAAAAKVSMSALGNRIAALLGASSAAEGRAAVQDAAPLLPSPPEAGEALVEPLQRALERSGLFYESHQAEWVAGQRSTEAVRAEPQARLAAAAQTREPVQGDDQRDGAGRALEQAAGARDVAHGPGRGFSAMAPDTVGGTVPPGIAALVERQLEALTTQQLAWRGEVWPGQDVEWIVREDRDAHGSPETAASRWSTQLTLELPRLGLVRARLDLYQGQLQVSIRAAGGDRVITSLRGGEAELRGALEARGLPLTAFAVQADGNA